MATVKEYKQNFRKIAKVVMTVEVLFFVINSIVVWFLPASRNAFAWFLLVMVFGDR